MSPLPLPLGSSSSVTGSTPSYTLIPPDVQGGVLPAFSVSPLTPCCQGGCLTPQRNWAHLPVASGGLWWPSSALSSCRPALPANLRDMIPESISRPGYQVQALGNFASVSSFVQWRYQQYLHPTADIQGRSSEYQTGNCYINVSLLGFIISLLRQSLT